MGTEQKLTLTALQMMIRDSIVLALPGTYWVAAEISELKINYSGHCYLELVEKRPGKDTIMSRARGVIWAARFRTIQALFESATGEKLREGLNVLVAVSVEYHELYGLSLNITDLDPAFTMGDMALKRREIIRRLTDDGIINMNAELEFPPVPSRVAVISSSSSAGFTDFHKQLSENGYGYSFNAELFNAPMQGEETEKGIISALDKIASRINQFDVVVILRGGGSAADLRWFDNYDIAFHITQFPIPVLTGIGHDKDISIADIVAWNSFKTPTAVASFLIEKMNDTDLVILALSERLNQAAKYIVLEKDAVIKMLARRILPTSGAILSESRRLISYTAHSLLSKTSGLIRSSATNIAVFDSKLRAESNRTITAASEKLSVIYSSRNAAAAGLINKKREELNGMEGLIRLSDPKNILKKGFSITVKNGKTVRSSGDLISGDKIVTKFFDGTINSEVISSENKRK